MGDLACHVRWVCFDGSSFQFAVDMDAASPVRDDPDSPQNNAPQLGVPGMPDFFASIMRFIRATAPGVPLDPVIFQSIMLSVMAGNKHVILRAKDEDISIVQNLAALVSNLTLFCPLACDCPLLSLDMDSSSPSPLPFPSGMSSSCSSDIQRCTRLHNSQTQDNAAIRRDTLVLHLIRLFFSVSRSANGKTGLLI